jgi:hypothetical protein
MAKTVSFVIYLLQFETYFKTSRIIRYETKSMNNRRKIVLHQNKKLLGFKGHMKVKDEAKNGRSVCGN